MRAITLWQPWASAIVLGLKRHETRTWPTSYRGTLAIHSAKRDPPGLCDDPAIRALVRDVCDLLGLRHEARYLPRGCVVAVAELTGCNEAGSIEVDPIERRWGDYSAGRFVWSLTDIRPLRDPVRCDGRQRLWLPSVFVERRIREQLEEKA